MINSSHVFLMTERSLKHCSFVISITWNHANQNHWNSIAHISKTWNYFGKNRYYVLFHHEFSVHKKFHVHRMYTLRVMKRNFHISHRMRILQKTPLAWLTERKRVNQSKEIFTNVLPNHRYLLISRIMTYVKTTQRV